MLYIPLNEINTTYFSYLCAHDLSLFVPNVLIFLFILLLFIYYSYSYFIISHIYVLMICHFLYQTYTYDILVNH